ncbi:MAG: polysaccharide deacetylase family protein [Bacteroidota bacterium]|nr:polysaccharide deacetylase family protein [Bacteroidota bacterium]MDP4212183.1 polysaccharide deacetylase family protein [Bacteroidota bacterium]MDP4249067.1 polysaccharide deacetylase family protein [Bacteroidota bacterium]
MLLYSQYTSPRLSYIIALLGNEIFNEPLRHTTDKTVFLDDSGPKINYSGERLSAGEFFIQNHPLLFEKGIREQKIHCFLFLDQPVFFKSEGDHAFDIFAACFYLLSRYEEYLPFEPDHYGRFPYRASLAFREKFLDSPLVNHWLESFKKVLRAKFPQLLFRIKEFRFIPSYDIDMAYSYRHKGFRRNAGGFVRSFLKGEWNRLLDRWDVLFQKKKDPFDTYEWLDSLHLYCRTRAYYFFLVARQQKGVDKNISPALKEMQALISYHARGYSLGIHPSWQSGDDDLLLREEIECLENITGIPVKCSRQHYIRMTLPQTYRNLIRAGIEKDFSMGYGGANGFRASIASSFYWYDLEEEKQTGLKLYPFCFMDANAYYETQLTPKEAFDELMGYYRKLKQLNGLMITVWHNQFFGTDPLFSGWKEVYEVFLKDQVYWDM